MSARTTRGIVLDFDGVIARSMEQHAEAYRRILAPFGIRVADRDVFVREGARSETLIRDLLLAAGKPAGTALVDRLAREKQAIFAGLGQPRLYPRAEALVRRLRHRVDRLGLVTGTRRENLDRIIPGLLPLFDTVLAQDAYTHDKPHPEPFEKAAKGLGIPPARCAALENAIRGVESARTAGYGFVVAITTTLGRGELERAGADVVVTDHDEAANVLEAWATDGRNEVSAGRPG